MRVVEEIPHNECKITIFSWNEKFIVKFEQGFLEQTYKVSEMDISSIEEIRKLTEAPFIDKVLSRFEIMHQDLFEALEDLY